MQLCLGGTMKAYKIGNIEIVRYGDETEDTLNVSSEYLSESLELIKGHNYKRISVMGDYNLPDIDFLKECPHIEILNLSGGNIKDFEGLSFLENLKTLSMNHLNKKVKVDLAKLTSLKELYGELPTRATGLSNLKNLKRMQIWDYKPHSKTFAELGQIENLEVLHLIQAKIESFEGIGQFRALQELNLYGLNKLTDITDIGLLRNTLRELIMENCKNIQDFSPIGEMKNLENLTLSSCLRMKSIAFAKELPKLNFFNFEKTDVEDGDLSYCQMIPTVYFTQKKHFSHKRKDLINTRMENILYPTLFWRERMEEGDDMFTLENILATEKALNDYLETIKDLKEKTSPKTLLTCVKEVVLKINVLNEKYNYFIETAEREELLEYILSVSELAGLETKSDITDEWRDW